MALRAGRVGVNPSQVDASGNIIGGGGGGGSYTLPTATKTRLGGVKIGNGLTVDEDGTISSNGGTPYELPTATKTRLGGVKIGNGLTADEDGTISADTPELPTATPTRLGGVKIGQGIHIATDGMISVVGGGDNEVYSYDEQLIGTWVDGSNLYKKTYHVTSLPIVNDNTYYDAVVLSDLNIDYTKPVHVDFVVKFGTGWVTGSTYRATDNTGLFVFVDPATQKIRVLDYAGKSTYSHTECYFTIKYTKTTD